MRTLVAVGLFAVGLIDATASNVALQQATATFSQSYGGDFSAAKAINGTVADNRGWAVSPNGGPNNSDQIAVFETASDIGFTGGSVLTFSLIHSFDGDSTYWYHTLGRFRLSVTTDNRSLFADGLASGGDVTANWTVLDPDSFTSTNGTTLSELLDHSILASALSPHTDIYTVTASTLLTGITGVRLEALKDPSLPFNGPGRKAENGNFVLSEFEMSIAPTTNCVPPPSGLVSWWQAESNALDSADGNNGVLVNGDSFAPGRVGTAFNFRGTNHVEVAASANLNVQSFSIEAWIFPDDVSTTKPIVEYAASTGYPGVHLWHSVPADGSPGATPGSLYANVGSIFGPYHFGTGGGVIPSNQWTHVALTYDQASGIARLFVNGTNMATANMGSITPDTTLPLNLGYRPAGSTVTDNAGFRFIGKMDEVSIYNRALSTNEIQSIVNADGAGKCPPSAPPAIGPFTNGSFELPVLPAGSGQSLPPGSTAITGWTVGSVAGMGWQNGASFGVNPVDGAQHIGFNGGNAAPGSYIFQTFSTTVGQTYAVSFSVGRNGSGSGTMSLLATATSSTDAVLGSLTAVAPGSPSYGSVQTFFFTATTTTSTLTFRDTSSATVNVDPLLDNVTVVPGSPPPPPPPPVGPFTNGSFEVPVVSPGGHNLPSGSTNITAWITGGTGLIAIVNGPAAGGVSPVDGAQHVAFGAGNSAANATLSQRFATSIGQTYTVSFSVGRSGGSGTMSLLAEVKSGTGASLGSLTGVAPNTQSYGPLQTFTFTATTTNSTLTFADTSSATVAVDVLLDNVSVTPGSGPCVAPPSGLVSWWQADSNALDSADSNHGALVGNAAYAAGKVGQAFSFDGSGDAIFIGNPANLRLQNLTIEGWVKRSSATQISSNPLYGEIVGYGPGGYVLGFRQDGSLFLSKNTVSDVPSVGTITNTAWHHVAVTKNGSTVVFYLDGVAEPAITYNTTFEFTTDLRIGAVNSGVEASFLGMIDELSIYNRALSATEVQSIHNAGSAGKCPPPMPLNHVPVANPQSISANEDTPKAVTLTGSDLDGDPLTYILVSGPTNGILSGTSSNLTYTPNTNFSGADGFRFKVNDGHVDSPVALVSINVLPANDPPVANPQSVNANEDTPLAITLVASDVDGDPLTYTVTPPSHGTLSGTAPNLTYTPQTNYFGPDSFTFKVNDGNVDSGVATVSINVATVNDAPVARASVSPLAQFPGDTNLIVISLNNTNAEVVLDGSLSTDVENDPLQYSWLEGTNVIASGVLATNILEVGTHIITLVVSDGMDIGVDTVTVEVITPAQAVGILISMVDEGTLLRKNQRPLIATLKAAAASFEEERLQPGVNQLNAFQNKVRAQVAPLDPTLADNLVNAAQVIIDALSGP